MNKILRTCLLLAAAAAVARAQTGFNWDGTPDTRPLPERCPRPGHLDDNGAMEVHLRCLLATLGNPVVLPNPANDEDAEDERALFGQYCNAVDEALEYLQGLLREVNDGPKGRTAAAVADLDELIRSSADAVRAFKHHIEQMVADPDERRCRDLFTTQGEADDGTEGADRVRATCNLLRNARPDDGARPDDDNYENAAGAVGLTVNVGGHLVPFPRWGSHHVPHERLASGQVPDGGAFVVLKEFFGLRLRLYWRWVPIWQEPWTSRARIIGYRRRLYLRWIPCEMLKSIVYEDDDHDHHHLVPIPGRPGSTRPPVRPHTHRPIVPRVVTRNWCDHSLLGFWRFF